MPSSHRLSTLHYFVAGLILAEGSFGKKTHRNTGRFTFTNTSPELIKLVYDFLLKQLEIPSDKIRIYVTYNIEVSPLPPDTVKRYWQNLLGISEEKVKVYPYKRKVKQVRRRALYGICQIRINDKEVRRKIEMFISTITNNLVTVVGGGHTESP